MSPVALQPSGFDPRTRDLTAARLNFKGHVETALNEIGRVIDLTEPEVRDLHTDRALEALAKVEAQAANLRRLLTDQGAAMRQGFRAALPFMSNHGAA